MEKERWSTTLKQPIYDPVMADASKLYIQQITEEDQQIMSGLIMELINLRNHNKKQS